MQRCRSRTNPEERGSPVACLGLKIPSQAPANPLGLPESGSNRPSTAAICYVRSARLSVLREPDRHARPKNPVGGSDA